ncbi:hypothetical protein J3U42_05220 [Gilliamella sp. B2923]|uniref:hypothetical protein n=1 Tax=Gilliamella sp. B2923 TaxID=2818005 RepID=UPI00226A1A62|nr:hypothetical protein [Gilliamella sp. B2923]MCX8617789.1 hypothetical protein [Gilliamella sp. B2923]
MIHFPTQEQLTNYFTMKSGQMAAITGFINHMKLDYNRELDIDRKMIQQMKAKQLKKRYSQWLIELYKKPNLTEDEQELICVVLYNLHDIMVKSQNEMMLYEFMVLPTIVVKIRIISNHNIFIIV